MSAIPAVKVANIWSEDPPVAGHYQFDENDRGIVYGCPCGCGQLRCVPISTGVKQPGSWLWDGNHERPTLQPSIQIVGSCKWHGFLTNGHWRTA